MKTKPSTFDSRQSICTAVGTFSTIAIMLLVVSPRAFAQTGPDYALSFNRTNTYVEVDTTWTVPWSTDPYTIEAWIRPNSMGNYGIVGWGNHGTTNQMNALSLRTNGLVNSWWGNDLAYTNTGLAGSWHHVAVTCNGSSWRIIYLDGVLVSSNIFSGIHAVPLPTSVSIGRTGTSNYFDGAIDEVRLWNQALPLSQIQSNRYRRLTGAETGLRAYWRFNEGSGALAADTATGNFNTGALYNNPGWVRSTVPFSPEAVTTNATLITTASARLRAKVHAGNLSAKAWFQWGTTIGYGNNTPQITVGPGLPADPTALTFDVSSVLTNLAVNTTYYFRIAVTNSVGTNYGDPRSFTTLSLPTGPGCALAFSGTNNYVLTPNLAGYFPAANTNVTLELWFNAEGPGVLVDELDNGACGWHNSQVEVVTTATNSAVADVKISVWAAAPRPILTLGQISYGDWNHVVLRYNQTNSTLDGFLNGIPTPGTTVVRSPPQRCGGSLFYALGLADTQSLGSGAYFDGQIDEFRVWNIARSTADIQASAFRPIAGNEPGLASYWRFDECSGTSAQDATGHGYDGTLSGNVSWGPSPVSFGPFVMTLPATNLTTTTASLRGSVNAEGFATTAWFQWGTNTSYGNTTLGTNLGSGNVTVTISTNIGALASFNPYHFRLVATNSYGTRYGEDQSFWFGQPLATTLPAYDIATNGATLSGAVIASGPSAQAWFQWGTTTNYGSNTALVSVGSGTVPIAVTNRLTGLVPGAVHHYRVASSNSFGVAYGTDLTFTNAFFAQLISLAGSQQATAMAWGDFDSDGDLDVVVSGWADTRLFRNDGTVFTEVAVPFADIGYGSISVGDCNNDGRPDLLLTGTVSSWGATSEVWTNNGSGWGLALSSPTLPAVTDSSCPWGDFDNDGLLDFVLTGGSGSGALAQIWRNTGSGFVLNTTLPGVYYSTAAWGDYDNDGWLDLLLAGVVPDGTGTSQATRLYHNNGDRTFSLVATPLPGVRLGEIAWGDYDNDRDLDILITGMSDVTEATIFFADFETGDNGFTYLPDPSATSNLWHRTTHRFASPTHSQYYGLEGTFTYDTGATTAGTLQSSPISLAGVTPPITLSFAYALQSEGGDWDRATVGVSTDGGSTWATLLSSADSSKPLALSAAFINATADLSAYAGSNILLRFNFNTLDGVANNYEGWYVDDVAIKKTVGPISRVYRNNGNGTFADISTGLTPLGASTAAWGDFDNDGWLDIALLGQTNIANANSAVARIYHNKGDGTFALVPSAGVVANTSSYGCLTVADYDKDGRLDVATSGYNNVTRIFRNYWPATNTPPTGPANLVATVMGTNALLAWTSGSDSRTPVQGLSYNLRVGTAPGLSNVVNPLAAANGWRRVPLTGNMQQNLSAMLTGLKFGSNYYWSVQAIDASFAGSPFECGGLFSICLAPSSCDVQVGSIVGNSAVIVASVHPNGSPTTAYIQWGTSSSYGNTTASILLGSGMGPVPLRQSLAGLQAGTQYHFRVVTSNSNGTTYGPDQTFYLDPTVALGDANGDGVIDQSELDAVLAEYWPTSPWLYMTNTAGLGETHVTFALTNSTAGAYSVLRSTNLANWEYLGPATPRYEFTDTNAALLPQRYYRLRWP
jgi:hypothetical protein